MFSIRTTKMTVLAMMIVVCMASVTFAQSNELADAERSSVMFDFNLKKIRSHKLMQDLDLKEMMQQQGIPENESFDVTKLNRIFGSMQMPSDPAGFQPAPGEDLKSNFFVRFEFMDSGAANDMVESFKEKGVETHEAGGKTYYSPGADVADAPKNLRIHLVNGSTVEMATERYAMLADRNVISKTLSGYWQQLPKESAIKLCVDIESNRDVVNQMVEQGKAAGGSQAEPFLNLVNDLAAVSLGLDFESENLLMLRAIGKDSEGAEKLRSGIDGLLGMGKFMGMQGLSQAPLDDSAKKVFGEVLNSLKATADGNTVKVDVKKPSAFDETVGEMMGK